MVRYAELETSGTPGSLLTAFRSRDIAQEAYDDAVEYLKKELRGNDNAHQLLQAGTSIHDVRDIVERVEVKYRESSNKGKGVRYWLRRFSATTMYYGNVLDMLAQHHPEYVALAWGTVKFVLTVRPVSFHCYFI